MATITSTSMGGSGARTATETTLDGSSDTFTYRSGRDAVLILRNPTAGGITAVIDGDGAGTVPVSGVGNVDISSGYSTGSIAAGAVAAIPLDTIAKYLAGTIAITGGTGLIAPLLER